MTPLITTISLITFFIISYIFTFSIKNYAESKKILDIPNHRSSHSAPVARGGGIAFIVVFLLGSLIAKLFIDINFINIFDCLALTIVAALGFLDDKISLPPLTRLLFQIVAVLIFTVSLSPIQPLVTSLFVIKSSAFLYLLVILYLVWMINLYNFMDGINGIASLEAISVCFGMCLVYKINNVQGLNLNLLFLISVVLGFLPWNFPRARIFMGDAGSSFLGLVLGVFSLHAYSIDCQLFWSWMALLGVFIVDSSVTLIRRIVSGEKIYLAHSSHAYQCIARKIGNHTYVTNMVVVINFVWLLPLAILISMHTIDGLLGVIIAYLPLVILTLHLSSTKNKSFI